MISFTNTLTGKREEFKSNKENEVKMYHCGPTVYDDAHIGNLRSFVLADTLRRLFEYKGYNVTQIMNVTDIGQLVSDGDAGEDKMVKGLKREGMDISLENMKALGVKYTERFVKDLKKINIIEPTKLVSASSEIDEQIKLIQTLEEKGVTYLTSDGVYFDTSQFEAYGELGNIDIEGLKEGARVDAGEKKNATDFALWKFNKEFGFESPWGQGSPGWHIECSAISQKYLGETFDIHTGGIDLIPIHHNNEIAQSMCATGKPLAHYWLHNAHVNLEGEKMAKSEGTGITLAILSEERVPPQAYRYFLLTAHYSSPISFSMEAGRNAESSYSKILNAFHSLKDGGNVIPTYEDQLMAHMENDLDTPQALALLHKLLKDTEIKEENKKETLKVFDLILGLGLQEVSTRIPTEVQDLLTQRNKARKEKDWETSDKLRVEIENHGFEVKDTGDETHLIPKL